MCLALNGIGKDARHPDYLLEVLSTSQFEGWRAFNRRHPFGQDHIHVMIARLIAMFYNVNRGKGAPAVDYEDFIPRVDTEELWREIDVQIEEQRRLEAMTREERDKEAIDKFMRAHAARMGKESK